MSGPTLMLDVPHDAMLLLIGPSGSGKSTFAANHFRPSEILSSDAMREMVADDPNDQSATDAAFELLHTALGLRLARRRLTVVDATNVEAWARAPLLAIARRHGRPAVAVVLALPVEECLDRNRRRRDRRLPAAAIRRQHRWLIGTLTELPTEGFAHVWILRSSIEASAARVVRAEERA